MMQGSAFELALHASLFVKLILGVLIGFSVGSWAVIVYKYGHFRAASRESSSFLERFRAGGDPQDLLRTARALEVSPLARLFRSVYPPRGSLTREHLDRSLKRQEMAEGQRLHGFLIFLAVTGSAAPFIGLLGTVWGIINAFRGIGAAGSASLAVVAPGIAEALITTAAGLAAAIPAVVAYNSYLAWARRIMLQTESFSEELKDLFAKEVA
ncbi:MAG: MotA/TolQ/ExbB proton channel family protein [Candidatus Omnitrophica bacterium]|nr:MotA/TolQ/ExbB proton channel family protein [Candidatus Omnitrophota bacterium]